MYGHGFDPEVATLGSDHNHGPIAKQPKHVGNHRKSWYQTVLYSNKRILTIWGQCTSNQKLEICFRCSQPSNRELNFVLVEYRPDLEEQSSIPSVLMIRYCLSNLQSISFPIFGQLVTKIRNYGTSFQISNLIWEFLTSKLLRRSNTDTNSVWEWWSSSKGSKRRKLLRWRVLNVFRK